MMQDYPKLLKSGERVGFTSIPKWYSFSTIKNDLKSAYLKNQQGLIGESAGECERDFFH